ncbi:hypothetical protein QUB52_18955 [Microcoleus sp. A6-C6]
MIDVRFLKIDRPLIGNPIARPTHFPQINSPTPPKLKDFADLSIARHRTLTINEPKSLK